MKTTTATMRLSRIALATAASISVRLN